MNYFSTQLLHRDLQIPVMLLRNVDKRLRLCNETR